MVVLLSHEGQDKIPDTELLEKAQMPSVFTLLEKAQVRWAGHVARMSKRPLDGEVCRGKCKVGGLKRRYEHVLQISLRSFHIDVRLLAVPCPRSFVMAQ